MAHHGSSWLVVGRLDLMGWLGGSVMGLGMNLSGFGYESHG